MWRSLGYCMVVVAACSTSNTPQQFDAAPQDAFVITGDAREGLDCHGELCAVGDVCCLSYFQPGVPSTFCVPSAAACPDLRYECDGPEDCAGGDICCSDGNPVQCRAAGECNGFTACFDDDDCPPSETCQTTPVGVVRVCQ